MDVLPLLPPPPRRQSSLLLMLSSPALPASPPPLSLLPASPALSSRLVMRAAGRGRAGQRCASACLSLAPSANPAPSLPPDHVTCLRPMRGGCETRGKGFINNASHCGTKFTHKEAFRRWTAQVERPGRCYISMLFWMK